MPSKRIKKHIGRGLWVEDHGFVVIATTQKGPNPTARYKIGWADSDDVIHIDELPMLEVMMRIYQPNLSRWKLCSQKKEGTEHANLRTDGRKDGGSGLPFANRGSVDERRRAAGAGGG